MMNASSSFTITHLEKSEDGIEADVLLNDKHDIFSGHFPGNPIVPGVLNLEIIQAILNRAIGKYKIGKISHLKFLRPVVPGESNELHYSIDLQKKDNGEISAGIKGLSRTEVHLKAQINFQPDE